jgi:CheY-like chemotaxis protein
MQFHLAQQDYTPPPSPGPAAGRAAATDGSRLRRKILVAEDDSDVRLMMRTLLEMKGYAVAEAVDGPAAIEAARGESPDLILMDLQLPRLNGFAVTRFVRQDDQLRGVPIIIVSGHDPARHRNIALAAGCNAYLLKPVDFDQLEGLINSLLPE